MWRRKKDTERTITITDVALEKGEKSIREGINELLAGIQELKSMNQGNPREQRG